MLPQGTDLSFINQLPAFAQAIIFGLLFIATAAAMWKGYVQGSKPAPAPPSPDMVLTGGTIADMKPVRDLAEGVDRLTGEVARIANSVERLIEISEADAEERRVEREVERRVRDERGEDPPPRRRR